MANSKLSGGGKKATPLLLKLGRLLGVQKRKQSDVVDLWFEMCDKLGQKTSERLERLLAFDIEQQGIELKVNQPPPPETPETRAYDDVAMANRMSRMAAQFTDEMMKREQEFRRMIQNLRREYELEMVYAKGSGVGDVEKTDKKIPR